MTELNDLDPVEIYDCRAYDFKLKISTSSFGAYTRQGIVEDKKVPKTIEFKSLEDTIKDPVGCSPDGMLLTPDLKYFDRPMQLHVGIFAVHAFREEFDRNPENTDADMEKIVQSAKAICEDLKENHKAQIDTIDEVIIKNTARFASCSITSMSAFLGGFIAQEIVKYTGKYTPLRQWFHYDTFESLPEGEVDRTPRDCRYDD